MKHELSSLSPPDRFSLLRKTYPQMWYESFELEESDAVLRVSYTFRIPPLPSFRPQWALPKPSGTQGLCQAPWVKAFAFHLGLIELLSYWKSACPPLVCLRTGSLTEEQSRWWRKLFYRGLSEFVYRNGLEIGEEEWVAFAPEESKTFELSPLFPPQEGGGMIVPVGGGKDSMVTLELLRDHGSSVYLFFLNPGRRQWGIADFFGVPKERVLVAHRTLDPLLLELNARGWLNGHVPFSAVLAFAAVWTAALFGLSRVVVSHESSANSSTVPGTMVNHQYSKSAEFEADFRSYLSVWLGPRPAYFSLLRPWNELQIAREFSRLPERAWRVFRSCNARTPQENWCGKCAKCLFVNLVLSPYAPRDLLRECLGSEPLDDPRLEGLFSSLILPHLPSPFECVGTKEECRASLSALVLRTPDPQRLPVLPRRALNQYPGQLMAPESIARLLSSWNQEHWIPQDLEVLLRERTPSLPQALEELSSPL